MLRSPAALLFALAFLGLAACSGGPDPDDGTSSKSKTPSEPSTSTDGTTPEKKPAAAEDEGSSSLGPSCSAYLDCCEELASAQPALAGSCDTTRDQIEAAQAKGASTDTYESACKQALAAAQGGGYCK